MSSAINLDQHILDAITVSGGLFGTLGSLYLTDELLEKRHVALRALTIFLTFGIPFGVVFALLGGWLVGVVACVVPGAWMASRVIGRSPGGLALIGLALWAAALGSVVWLVNGETASIWAVATALMVGAILSLVIARLGRPRPQTPPRHRVLHFGGGFALAAGATVGIALGSFVLYLGGLLTPLWPSSTPLLLAMAALIGALSATGPFLVDRIGRLPKGQLGAIGLFLILLGFLAQSCAPLASLLDVAPH